MELVAVPGVIPNLAASRPRDEHHGDLARMQRAVTIAMVAWPLFALVDLFIAGFLAPGRLWFFLAIRAIGMVPLMVAFGRLHGVEPPGPRELRFIDACVCGSLSVLVAITCVELGGLPSPIVLGVFTIMMARSAVLADHWRRGLFPIVTIVVAYPAAVLLMAMLVPAVGAQLSDRTAVAYFVLNEAFLIAAGVMVLVGGHYTFRLRSQVFEQRALGRYKLDRKIGAGGMGEVWAAHHAALKRDVAVKILRPEKVSDENVARFEREVRATAELVHPNTVRVFDYGTTDDGLWYYAMELLEGVDLRKLVLSGGPLEPARAVNMIWQAARAVAEAHRRGITHRDLKPENLFVTNLGDEGDFIKVLDFGLAKLVAGEGSDDLTNDGFAVGTPKYISPEVLFGQPADARSDVYALGAVLYFCLCGAAPFDFPDARRTLLAHMNDAPVPPSYKLGRSIPPAIEAVVMRCLAKDPAERYANGAELASALEAAALSSTEIPTRPLLQRVPQRISVVSSIGPRIAHPVAPLPRDRVLCSPLLRMSPESLDDLVLDGIEALEIDDGTITEVDEHPSPGL